ncbi:g4931 [Coccomyxa elongata]
MWRLARLIAFHNQTQAERLHVSRSAVPKTLRSHSPPPLPQSHPPGRSKGPGIAVGGWHNYHLDPFWKEGEEWESAPVLEKIWPGCNLNVDPFTDPDEPAGLPIIALPQSYHWAPEDSSDSSVKRMMLSQSPLLQRRRTLKTRSSVRCCGNCWPACQHAAMAILFWRWTTTSFAREDICQVVRALYAGKLVRSSKEARSVDGEADAYVSVPDSVGRPFYLKVPTSFAWLFHRELPLRLKNPSNFTRR